MKKLIHLTLLIAISFSIAHGIFLDIHQDSHCSVQEFAEEFSHPIEHDLEEHNGDLCNSHFMLHLSFLVPTSFTLEEIKVDFRVEPFYTTLNHYHYKSSTFRPPIA